MIIHWNATPNVPFITCTNGENVGKNVTYKLNKYKELGMIIKEDLIKTAKEMQAVMNLDPAIPCKGSETLLKKEIKSCFYNIEPTDVFSDSTKAVIMELGFDLGILADYVKPDGEKDEAKPDTGTPKDTIPSNTDKKAKGSIPKTETMGAGGKKTEKTPGVKYTNAKDFIWDLWKNGKGVNDVKELQKMAKKEGFNIKPASIRHYVIAWRRGDQSQYPIRFRGEK